MVESQKTEMPRRCGKMAFLLALFLCSAILAPDQAPAKEHSEIRIALRPAKTLEGAVQNHRPLIEYLEKKIGIPIKAHVGKNYKSVIEALRNKEVEIAYLGPYSYVLAHNALKGRIEPLVVGIRESARRNVYASIIVAAESTRITDPRQFNNSHVFSIPDPASTTGYLIPTYRFLQLGLEPNASFKSVHIAGNHAGALMAVQNGVADGAGTNILTYELLHRAGLIDIDKVRIIWKSPNLPLGPITVRKDVPGEIKYRLLKAFTSIPPGVGTYEGKFERYEPAYDEKYKIIRNLYKELNLMAN